MTIFKSMHARCFTSRELKEKIRDKGIEKAASAEAAFSMVLDF
ncbi:MAG: hypothetical protein AAB682_02470 [Patescibacteria group bacterium]